MEVRDWTYYSPLYNHLVSMGESYPLSLQANEDDVRRQLSDFGQDWRLYNPTKPEFKRSGLSLTSRDGQLHGDDLTSLRELLSRDPTVTELSFRKLTKVYDACPAIQAVVEPFVPYLGRSHFLRFDEGGFFPWHRDWFGPCGDTFRIFVPFLGGNSRDFIFLLGNERLHFDSGRAYFINTRIEHSVFSFAPDSIHLVLNVELSYESVMQVCHAVHSR